MGRDKLGSSTEDETSAMPWATLHSHEVMAEFSQHNIKCHPSITYIFVGLLIKTKIPEPPQDIYQMNREIKGLNVKSNRHNVRLNKT